MQLQIEAWPLRYLKKISFIGLYFLLLKFMHFYSYNVIILYTSEGNISSIHCSSISTYMYIKNDKNAQC